jgi:hypothetical protein
VDGDDVTFGPTAAAVRGATITGMERTIEASTLIQAEFADARAALVEDAGSVIGDDSTLEERRDRRVRLGLHVDVGAGAGVHQQVWLQLGEPRCTEATVVLPVVWRATGRERLFPRFVGHLGVADDGGATALSLEGTYTVPLGLIGRFGDGVGGRRLARRSLAEMVERVARRLDAEVARRVPSVPSSPVLYRVAVAEHEHSEVYIG